MKKRIIPGIILAILALALSIVSEATQDFALMTSYITGALELLFHLIFIPLVYYAGEKNPKGKRERGEFWVAISKLDYVR